MLLVTFVEFLELDGWNSETTTDLHNPKETLPDFYPIGSMDGIFTYIYHKHQAKVGKYIIHGSYGYNTDFFADDWRILPTTPNRNPTWVIFIVIA